MCLSTAETKTTQSNGDIPVASGVTRMKGPIAAGVLGLAVSYFAVFFAFKESELIKPAAKVCEDVAPGEVCTRSDLLAFQLSSGLAISYCGLIGFYVWHMSRTVHTRIPQTPQGRLYGYLPEGETLAAFNFTFQFWDFFISLGIPEHCEIVMLLHHFAAASVCYLSLKYQVS